MDASRSFDRNGGGIVEYIWDWGDGTNATGVLADHAYLTNGKYKITLKVINEINMRDTTSSLVIVERRSEGPSGICYIVIPIGLIAVGGVAVYFFRKKRKRSAVVVEVL